jgi:serine/threonine-protein kinase HipA
VPNIGFNQEHVLRIGLENRPPDLGTLLEEAKHFGIKRQQNVMEMLREVHTTVSEWRTVFEECFVPETDTEQIGRDIRSRLGQMSLDLP